MNKDNMQKVLDYIIAHPNEFNMANFDHIHQGCLTAACICGTANFLANNNDTTDTETASSFLGLTHEQGCFLFYSNSIWRKYMEELELEIPLICHITQLQAVVMLTHLINGKWNFDGVE